MNGLPLSSRRAIPGIAAFTLIELLTVIGVIGLLAATLLPAVNSMKKRAQAGQCLSNMRQIGNAIFTYSADNSGRMMPYAAKTPSGGLGPYYLELLGPYLPEPKDASFTYSRIFRCPAQRGSRVPGNPTNNQTDYGMAGLNGILFGICSPTTGKSRFSLTWCDRSPNLANIPFRSQAMMISDISKSFMWSTDTMKDPAVQGWRHSDGINCIFADGHGEYRSRQSVPEDTKDVFWNGGNSDPVPL